MTVSADILVGLYGAMVTIRRFEEKIIDVYPVQDMKSPVHLCIGQEAVAAGVCAHLRRDDYLFTTHRGHGHCLAKGMDPYSLYSEFYGRETGCSRGKGGSMHPVCPELGILGTSAIVGGAIPLAVGAALSAKTKGNGRVSAVFFGDGAADQGVFHESLNFAALKKLPVIFVCENNFYAVNSHISARQTDDNIVRHGVPYNIPGEQVDGTNALHVYEAAGKAVDRARSGGGPTLLECRFYRWRGHVGPECDYPKGCRPKEELEEWMERCPIDSMRQELFDQGFLTEQQDSAIRADIEESLEQALQAARQSPLPGPQEVFTHVYFEGR